MLLYTALEKDVPFLLGVNHHAAHKEQDACIRQRASDSLAGRRGQVRVSVVVCYCCPQWWIVSVLPALLRPVSPAPLKLCPGEAWGMEWVGICTHRQTDEAVWNPGRCDNRRGTSGNQSHAILLLLPTQGWRSASETPNKSWCCLLPTASHTWSQPLLQELLHSEQVLSHWSRAGDALSCTDINSLVLGWWLFWGQSSGLLLSSFECFMVFGTWTFVPIKHFTVEFVEKTHARKSSDQVKFQSYWFFQASLF